jgi:hypothetical protein
MNPEGQRTRFKLNLNRVVLKTGTTLEQAPGRTHTPHNGMAANLVLVVLPNGTVTRLTRLAAY